MSDTIEIQVQIEEVNKERNQIIFKPYSPEFKKSIEEYPSKAIDMTALDLTKSLEDQLLKMSAHYVKQTLFEENNEKYLANIQEITLQTGNLIKKDITTQQLFAPETISTAVPATSSTEIPKENFESTGEPVSSHLESTDIFSVV